MDHYPKRFLTSLMYEGVVNQVAMLGNSMFAGALAPVRVVFSSNLLF
jgi:hypothetical protein